MFSVVQVPITTTRKTKTIVIKNKKLRDNVVMVGISDNFKK